MTDKFANLKSARRDFADQLNQSIEDCKSKKNNNKTTGISFYGQYLNLQKTDAKNNENFTKFVDNWLHEWTGWSVESIFEVNSIVINPELVFFSNYNKGVFDYCESIGVTPHIVPFRHRHFWDGGLHCLTLDILREGEMQSYFN